MTRIFNRKQLIAEYQTFLLETGLTAEQVILSAGGACVLYNIRCDTVDLDLDVPAGFYSDLKRSAQYPVQQTELGECILYSDSYTLHVGAADTKTCMVDGVCLYNPQALYDQKLRLNREKDQDDLRYLKPLVEEPACS